MRCLLETNNPLKLFEIYRFESLKTEGHESIRVIVSESEDWNQIFETSFKFPQGFQRLIIGANPCKKSLKDHVFSKIEPNFKSIIEIGLPDR
jgi:hypothetical protein